MENNLNAALLVMDVQNAIVNSQKDTSAFIANVQGAIQATRNRNIPVLYVVVGFRKNYPEVSPVNKFFSLLKNSGRNLDDPNSYTVHASILPREDEMIITKKRISAFTGSDLEVILRGRDIRHIVLTGISTSGVVLSTLREAGDKDFKITVLADACFDADEEVHRVLTTKVFPRQADVMNVGEWNKLN